MKRLLLAALVTLAVVGVSTGCSAISGSGGSAAPSVTVSMPSASISPSSGYGKQAVCALGSAGISLIRAGGAGSRALAEIIAANVQDPNVKNMANAVINSTADGTVRNQLADWLTTYCGS